METALSKQLAGGSRPRPTALDAFKIARRMFIAGDRIDVQSIAHQLGVNRATVYRWVGGRDQLVAEVVWSMAERSFDDPTRWEPAAGQSRAAEVINGFVRDILTNSGMQMFLDRDGLNAMRLLTSPVTEFQSRLIALVRDLLEAEITGGNLKSDLPTDDLAYVVVRIVESYVYLALITGEEPDEYRANRVINTLLPPA